MFDLEKFVAKYVIKRETSHPSVTKKNKYRRST